jgi:hypothetical protein
MYCGTKTGSNILASPLFSPDANIHILFHTYSRVFELYILFLSLLLQRAF